MAVALSAVIVALFCAYHIFVSPPSQAAETQTPTESSVLSSTQESPVVSNAPTYVRKEQCYTFLLAASDQSSGNADTIMLVTYDVPSSKVGVVSIPRDTLVKGDGYQKINHAYLAGGIDELRNMVSDLVGYPIDYYITVDIDAFKAIVNAVDGVDFYIPCSMNYDDPTQSLSIHYSEGSRHLNGQQAMEVVRFRKNNDGSGYSDVGRTQTQQKLLTAVAKKVLSLSSLPKLNEFIDIFSQNVTTDLSASDLTYFSTNMLKVDPKTDVSTSTLPGDGTVTYRGTKWCYQLYPNKCLKILNASMNPYTTALTQDDLNILQVS
jgi:LCP family protein required for cell wall assembly